jgi:hypothetical protein
MGKLDPATEIKAVLAGDPEAWKRWRAYDTKWEAEQAAGKQPWVLCVNLWGWSPYMCMLNQQLNLPVQGQYTFPTPDLLGV